MFNTTVKSDEDVIKYGKEILKKGHNQSSFHLVAMVQYMLINIKALKL